MRINIVYAIPPTSRQFVLYEDGFTAAVELLSEHHDIRWLNVHPYFDQAKVNQNLIPECDMVLIKSDWGWLPARAADRALLGNDVPIGLLISGSSQPPEVGLQLRYDVLFYETPWYRQFITEHPFTVQAFGIDTKHMRNTQARRDIDWLMVGRLADFKRPERLLEKSGVRVAIGDQSVERPVATALRQDGVELRDMVSQKELAGLYNRAHSVLVPCELQGGGERAVLEARSCGCTVEIADDNPKLASLMDSPVPTHHEYAAALEAAITAVVGGRRIDPRQKRAAQRRARRAVILEKVRRGPSTLVIRARGLAKRRRAG